MGFLNMKGSWRIPGVWLQSAGTLALPDELSLLTGVSLKNQLPIN